MFRSLTLCAAVAALLALPSAGLAGEPQPPAPGTLLGSTGQIGGSLIEIDPATGAGVLVGSLGSFGPVTEIEFRGDGVLFGSTGGGSSNVIVIDPATGDETLVGQHDLFGSLNGLEFVDTTLYGALFAPPGPPPVPPAGDGGPPDNLLVTVDTADASLTVIGPITGFSPVRGLAYDAATGTMYGVGVPVAAAGEPDAPEGISDVLFTVDLATGTPTPIGPLGEFVGALEFGPDGTLYAGEVLPVGAATDGADGWGSGTVPEGGGGGRLFTIDPATGDATPVGPTGFPTVSGLSFVPGGGTDPGTSVLEIPSLSGLGLLLLAGLLAAAGLIAVRRL